MQLTVSGTRSVCPSGVQVWHGLQNPWVLAGAVRQKVLDGTSQGMLNGAVPEARQVMAVLQAGVPGGTTGAGLQPTQVELPAEVTWQVPEGWQSASLVQASALWSAESEATT
jgi:hypothetical protein